MENQENKDEMEVQEVQEDQAMETDGRERPRFVGGTGTTTNEPAESID